MTKRVITDTIAVTSKGTFVLPVRMRRLLGIVGQSAKLNIKFNSESGEAVISKMVELSDIQVQMGKTLRAELPPLLDVSRFYSSRRKR